MTLDTITKQIHGLDRLTLENLAFDVFTALYVRDGQIIDEHYERSCCDTVDLVTLALDQADLHPTA